MPIKKFSTNTHIHRRYPAGTLPLKRDKGYYVPVRTQTYEFRITIIPEEGMSHKEVQELLEMTLRDTPKLSKFLVRRYNTPVKHV